jgi:hypothetical protein
MPAEKGSCPTCGRTVTVLADGTARRHKPPVGIDTTGTDLAGWCPGGPMKATATVMHVGELGKVIDLRPKGDRSKKAPGMTTEEKAHANASRPPSKALDRHGHGSCGARIRDKRTGVWDGASTCSNAKGQGTDHLGFGRCKNHGGSSPNGKRHAALERARAEAARVRREMTFYGKRVAVDPEQALLEEMQRSVGVVRWLEAAIAEWGQFERMAEELAELDPAPDDAGDATEALLERLNVRAQRILAGEAVTEGVTHDDHRTGLPSLVAVHSTERAVGFTDTEYRAWLKVYQEERRHLAAVAKACIEANIAERRQSVLEARGEMIRSLVVIALRIAGVQATEERALEIVAEATRTVARELPA